VTATQIVSLTTDTSVIGGKRFGASVTLNRPAPAGGLKVTITSDKSAVPPATIFVPEDVTTFAFDLSTIAVDRDTPATISAKTTNAQALSTTTVLAPTITSVSLDTNSIMSGGRATMTITLSGEAPAGGLVLSLSTSNSAAIMPTTVVVAGGKKSVKVSVKGDVVSTTTQAVLTATFAASSKSVTLTIHPAP
jgi:hypothetical protein